jgi:hypothetical protein
VEGWIESFLLTHELDGWGGGYRLRHFPDPGTIGDQDARALHAFAIIKDTLSEAAPVRDPMAELETLHAARRRESGRP